MLEKNVNNKMGNRIADKVYDRLSCALIFCMAIMLFVVVIFMGEPQAYGEWDDFSLITVSVLNDGNVTIDEQDILQAKEWMPQWKDLPISLSGYYTKNGDALSWYFPLFSVMCAPVMAGLLLLGQSGIYTFSLVNIGLYLFALIYAYRKSGFSARVKFWFILSLSVSPIVIYTIWVSCEIFIFTFLLLSVICWNNGRYKTAAVYLSIASTVNPSVLMFGIIMIIEYLYLVLCETGIRKIWKRAKDIALLACCYIPCLFPFARNLYYVGHINMTAATEMDRSIPNVMGRFFSYWFDLNLGFLPYYGVLLLLLLVAIVDAIRKRNRKVILLAVAGVGISLIYSLEIHINSGMSGLARYNAWTAVLIIMAVFVWRNGYNSCNNEKVLDIGALCSVGWTALASLSIVLTSPICYLEMTPIAKVVLEYAPQLYEPLPIVFSVRVNHRDEIEYRHHLPIVYRDGDWQCRKILAEYENKEQILERMNASEEDIMWLKNELDTLKGKGEQYISIPKGRKFYWNDN